MIEAALTYMNCPPKVRAAAHATRWKRALRATSVEPAHQRADAQRDPALGRVGLGQPHHDHADQQQRDQPP